MAKICNLQNAGSPDIRGWDKRPNWKGIVYIEGNLVSDFASHVVATGHIDLWDEKKSVHAEYPGANVVWFWKMGA